MTLAMRFTGEDIRTRDQIIALTSKTLREGTPIPARDPRFSGHIAGRYFEIEGEDDLVHITVDKDATIEEGKEIVHFLVPDVPIGLIWFKPGEDGHHFFLAHDDLLRT